MDAAMVSAVSGLQAQSTALSNISNNLANSQTTGYKAVETQFTSLLTELSNGSTFTSGGVAATARQNVTQSGTITATSTSTDMAINGNGMFAVTYGTSGGQVFYTRNGAFDPDQSGNLQISGTNYYLQGWPTDTTGKVTVANPDNTASLEPVNIDQFNSLAVATTQYSMTANLPAAAADEMGTIPYTNSAGVSENLTMSYVKTGSTPASGGNDATDTYMLTVNAPTGQTISDGTTADAAGTNFSQLTYQVTVDTTGANAGTILAIQGATNGATTEYSNGTPTNASATVPATAATFPTLTPSDTGGTAITYPTSWTAGTPTWGQVSTTAGTGFSQNTSMTVYDSKGVEQSFPVTWTVSGNNTWLMTVNSPTNAAGSTSTGQLVDSTGAAVNSYTYQVSFNSDGTLGTMTPMTTSTGGLAPTTTNGTPELLAKWDDGSAASTGSEGIVLNLGTQGKTDGLSLFSTTSSGTPQITVKSTSQNGVEYGQLTGVSVNSAGELIAAYDNGQKVPIYKIPVATFPNENGLTEQTDGVYSQSSQSGNPILNSAGNGGAGTLEGQSLEGSTVNTSVEFSNMITAQQAYSSASQVIGIDKQMFTSLIQVVQ